MKNACCHLDLLWEFVFMHFKIARNAVKLHYSSVQKFQYIAKWNIVINYVVRLLSKQVIPWEVLRYRCWVKYDCHRQTQLVKRMWDHHINLVAIGTLLIFEMRRTYGYDNQIYFHFLWKFILITQSRYLSLNEWEHEYTLLLAWHGVRAFVAVFVASYMLGR